MRATPAILFLTVLVAAACSGDDAPEAGTTTTTGGGGSDSVPVTLPPVDTAAVGTAAADTTEPEVPDTLAILDLSDLAPMLSAEFRPGVEQLAVLGAEPGLEVSLVALPGPADVAEGAALAPTAVAAGTVDEFGSLLFRGVEPGDFYFVESAVSRDGPFQVLSRDTHPNPAFFAEQRLPAPGYGYITMRDGTTLAANVVLPGPVEDGPYPTVVEYSGYTPADPEGQGFADLFTPLGYAYVGVNMRGTGCSGGSFRYFEYAQSIDGYDVIEAVAAQPWVFDNRVGMVGVSYPGISQLFVAQTQPPSLAAITPFSVIDDSYNSTLYPGGLLNTGFAVEWTQDRVDQARPAVDPAGAILDEGGQSWAKDRIATGDDECTANQSMRLQNPDLISEVFDTPFYEADVGDEISPRLFVDLINVPTFVAGAWQDEQTGGRFPTMLDRFTGTEHLYVSLMNGLHTESIGPANFPRWVEFLDLYVAQRTPTLDTARTIAPILASGLYGTGPIELPPDRFAGMSYDDALAAFETEPAVRVLFEEGAADGTPARTPLPRFVEEFEAWPIPGVEPTEWFLATDGALLPEAEPDNSRAGYLALPEGFPPTFYEGSSSDIWRVDVEWDWQEPAPGTAATFLSAPLGDTVTMIGSASADLWINSNLGDTDVEVTLTEVRPDGQEMYVQSGWLRASQRKLDDAASTVLQPVHTHLEADVEPLTGGDGEGDFDLVRVEVFPFAHVFRAGSQIRISIDAPGGNRPVWIFDTIAGGEQVQVALGGDFPSKVVLPVVAGIEPPAEYPECGALRGQPCRAFTG
ncbi:MAG: CocE/NonD family hydrolase [Ilumatobacter sp.]|nr:CocE/NonD family hydrolase [Ilumatobacter sp.]